MELIKGKNYTINIPNHGLNGLPVLFVRQSPKTGECIVELMEDRGVYRFGDKIMVKRWELT